MGLKEEGQEQIKAVAKKKIRGIVIKYVLPVVGILLGILLIITITIAAGTYISERVQEAWNSLTGWVDGVFRGNGVAVTDDQAIALVHQIEEYGFSMADLGMAADSETIAADDAATQSQSAGSQSATADSGITVGEGPTIADTLQGDYEGTGVSASQSSLTPEERRSIRYLKKFLEASVATQTVDTHHNGISGIAGCIKLKRRIATDPDHPIDVRSVSSEEELLRHQNNSDYQKYYWIDGENKIVVLNKTGNDTFAERRIEYDSEINNYKIPVMFFVDLCLGTRNPNYVYALAEEIINHTEIDLTLEESVTVSTTVETSTVQTRNVETQAITSSTPTTTTTTTTTGFITPVITLADTLLYKVEQTVDIQSNSTTSEPEVTDTDWERDERGEVVQDENSVHDSGTTMRTIEEDIRTETSSTTTTESHYFSSPVQSDPVMKSNEDDAFVQLTKRDYALPYVANNANAYDSYKRDGGLIFMLMEQNMGNDRLLNILKYMVYLITNVDYGVTDLNSSLLNIRNFTTTSSGGVTATFINSYENGALQSYMAGNSSYNSYVAQFVTEDRTQYRMFYTSFDGCLNFSYGIMVRNSAGNENNKAYFEEEGLDLTSLIAQYNRGEDVLVDVAKLDRINAKLINDKKNALKAVLEERGAALTSNQLDALVNVSYQYGNCGEYIAGARNIAEVYKTYYMQGQPDAFKNNAVCYAQNGSYPHFFITNNYKEREKYNWLLFNEGVYTLSDGTVVTGGNIVDKAQEIHDYMQSNQYVYSLGGLPYSANDAPNSRNTCCSTYVDWVLAESGYKDKSAALQHRASELFMEYAGKFEVIESYDELQAGDIIFETSSDPSGTDTKVYNGRIYKIGHVQICAGTDKWYNAGTPNAISSSAPSYDPSYARAHFQVGLRPN